MNKINLVKDLDTLSEIKQIKVHDLEKGIYSLRIDFDDLGPMIKPEASLEKLKKIISRKEYVGAKFYIKKGGYFD